MEVVHKMDVKIAILQSHILYTFIATLRVLYFFSTNRCLYIVTLGIETDYLRETWLPCYNYKYCGPPIHSLNLFSISDNLKLFSASDKILHNIEVAWESFDIF